MSRPKFQRPCRRHHPKADDPVCPFCRLFRENAARHAQWLPFEDGQSAAQPTPPPSPRPPRRICIHRGETATGETRQRLGLSHFRDWYKCAMGLGTGGYVCPCRGCGPKCSQYLVEPPAADAVE